MHLPLDDVRKKGVKICSSLSVKKCNGIQRCIYSLKVTEQWVAGSFFMYMCAPRFMSTYTC